jgi:hypothetical protein
MAQSPSNTHALKLFSTCLNKVPDPRSKHGTNHPFTTILALTLLGLLGNVSTPAEIARWTKQHFHTLKKFLPFGKIKGKLSSPCDNTFTRILRKLSLAELQNAFAEFVNILLTNTDIVAAVDGKSAKQMKDANGDPILMLNVFAQSLKLHLASWNVRGDKTNEPTCLKKHLKELFTMYPSLTLLTGDAIFAQRPLLEALKEYHCDYLFQVKANQKNILKKMKFVFAGVEQQEPDDVLEVAVEALPQKQKKKTKSYDRKVNKKRGLWKSAVCG